MRLEETLLGLSRTTQYLIALTMLGISTWAWLHGWVWPWWWIIGSVLLWCSCFSSKAGNRDDE